MPAEKVNDRTDPTIRAQVHWGRESGIVQLSTVMHVANGGTDEAPGHFEWDGVFVDLDRTSINVLIRSLRKARDQVFGADA